MKQHAESASGLAGEASASSRIGRISSRGGEADGASTRVMSSGNECVLTVLREEVEVHVRLDGPCEAAADTKLRGRQSQSTAAN